MSDTQWKTYEEVAAYLLDQFAEHFGVGRFEGKQLVSGASGTVWEIDAKGCTDREGHFIVVECKRYTKTRIAQATVGSLAWTIVDSKASGGIFVSPKGFQKGARKVAENADIHEVLLTEDSTTKDYVLKFLNDVRLGFSSGETVKIADSTALTLMDKNGNITETREI